MVDPADGLPRAGTIDGDRVRLVPLTPGDADELFPVLDDERLHAFIGGRPASAGELRRRLEEWAAERSPGGREAWLNWIVRSTDDGRVLGTTQATVVRASSGLRAAPGLRADVAWTIASSDQGRGLGSEAARAMVVWLVDRGADRIDAHVRPDHAASAGVARSAGLTATDEIVDGEVVWRLAVAPGDGGG